MVERGSHHEWIHIIPFCTIFYIASSLILLMFKERIIPSPFFIDLNSPFFLQSKGRQDHGNIKKKSMRNHWQFILWEICVCWATSHLLTSASCRAELETHGWFSQQNSCVMPNFIPQEQTAVRSEPSASCLFWELLLFLLLPGIIPKITMLIPLPCFHGNRALALPWFGCSSGLQEWKHSICSPEADCENSGFWYKS